MIEFAPSHPLLIKLIETFLLLFLSVIKLIQAYFQAITHRLRSH